MWDGVIRQRCPARPRQGIAGQPALGRGCTVLPPQNASRPTSRAGGPRQRAALPAACPPPARRPSPTPLPHCWRRQAAMHAAQPSPPALPLAPPPSPLVPARSPLALLCPPPPRCWPHAPPHRALRGDQRHQQQQQQHGGGRGGGTHARGAASRCEGPPEPHAGASGPGAGGTEHSRESLRPSLHVAAFARRRCSANGRLSGGFLLTCRRRGVGAAPAVSLLHTRARPCCLPGAALSRHRHNRTGCRGWSALRGLAPPLPPPPRTHTHRPQALYSSANAGDIKRMLDQHYTRQVQGQGQGQKLARAQGSGPRPPYTRRIPRLLPAWVSRPFESTSDAGPWF